MHSHVCSTQLRLHRKVESGDPASDVDLQQECQKSDATEYGDEEHSDDENDQKMWKIFRERRAELLREA